MIFVWRTFWRQGQIEFWIYASIKLCIHIYILVYRCTCGSTMNIWSISELPILAHNNKIPYISTLVMFPRHCTFHLYLITPSLARVDIFWNRNYWIKESNCWLIEWMSTTDQLLLLSTIYIIWLIVSGCLGRTTFSVIFQFQSFWKCHIGIMNYILKSPTVNTSLPGLFDKYIRIQVFLLISDKVFSDYHFIRHIKIDAELVLTTPYISRRAEGN